MNTRKILISFLVITFCVIKSYSQITRTIYYDADWNKVKSKKTAIYYRNYYESNDTIFVKDYYLNGTLQMMGQFTDKEMKNHVGYFIYYFENGNKDHEGIYINSKKEGEWKWYLEGGSLCGVEIYLNDERIEETYFDEQGNIIPDEEGERIAKFPGGNEGYIKFVKENITYPELARVNKITGKVIAKLKILPDGTPQFVEIISDTHEILNKEVIRVIENLPKFIPSRYHNRPNSTYFNLPVNFNL